MADYKLADLIGIAGATIGIIIAAGIMLHCLSTKYVAAFERFRSLTGEYCANSSNEQRHESLRRQIVSYCLQSLFLNLASMLVAGAVLAFLLTVAIAGLSVMYPQYLEFRLLGTISLFSGLGFLGGGTFLILLETYLQRRDINQELHDFHDLPSTEEAAKT
jgi:hypothetical protein